MQIAVTKGKTEDLIRITRSGGERAETRFPKKGPLPHDLVHLVAEDAFGLRRAFWGLIAGGRHPEDIGALAASLGHSSAARAHVPDPAIIELLQAERLLECFEAEIWGGPAAMEDLQAVTEAGFSQSLVPSVRLDAADVTRIRAELARLGAEWAALPIDGSLRCAWPD